MTDCPYNYYEYLSRSEWNIGQTENTAQKHIFAAHWALVLARVRSRLIAQSKDIPSFRSLSVCLSVFSLRKRNSFTGIYYLFSIFTRVVESVGSFPLALDSFVLKRRRRSRYLQDELNCHQMSQLRLTSCQCSLCLSISSSFLHQRKTSKHVSNWPRAIRFFWSQVANLKPTPSIGLWKQAGEQTHYRFLSLPPSR